VGRDMDRTRRGRDHRAGAVRRALSVTCILKPCLPSWAAHPDVFALETVEADRPASAGAAVGCQVRVVVASWADAGVGCPWSPKLALAQIS
jgi:hypothetical protein